MQFSCNYSTLLLSRNNDSAFVPTCVERALISSWPSRDPRSPSAFPSFLSQFYLRFFSLFPFSLSVSAFPHLLLLMITPSGQTAAAAGDDRRGKLFADCKSSSPFGIFIPLYLAQTHCYYYTHAYQTVSTALSLLGSRFVFCTVETSDPHLKT